MRSAATGMPASFTSDPLAPSSSKVGVHCLQKLVCQSIIGRVLWGGHSSASGSILCIVLNMTNFRLEISLDERSYMWKHKIGSQI